MNALTGGNIDYSPQGKSYDHGPSKRWLQEYLTRLDNNLFELADQVDWLAKIDWFGAKVQTFEHLMRLVSHETLHHGQWVVYMRLMNKPFPDSWAVWGL